MKILIMGLLAILALVGLSGYVERSATGSYRVEGTTVDIASGNVTYPAYLAVPSRRGPSPAVVLVHSINGFEPGYGDLTDRLASEGYVVLSPKWQTFEQRPKDETVEGLLRSSAAYLRSRQDVDGNLGLAGFCIGGRYTMLFLPQMDEFKSGVAWYGFPYSGGFANQSTPASMIGRLKAPLLMIHGTNDRPSPIADIYSYAAELNASGKYFELKVYQGQPHGFMMENGELSQAAPAKDAYREMAAFFERTLRRG